MVAPSRPLAVQTAGVLVLKVTVRPEFADRAHGERRLRQCPVDQRRERDRLIELGDHRKAAADRRRRVVARIARLAGDDCAFPGATRVMVAPSRPLEVHTAGVVVVKVTGRPELAITLTAMGDSADARFGNTVNLMLWLSLATTLKLTFTDGAALSVTLPGWLALTVHFPVVTRVMVAPSRPLAVQTAGVLVVKVTGRPELAVALTVKGDCANPRFGKATNVIA